MFKSYFRMLIVVFAIILAVMLDRGVIDIQIIQNVSYAEGASVKNSLALPIRNIPPEIKKINNSASEFGYSTALDGDTLVVGARGEDNYGAVYIFERHLGGADSWGLSKKLMASDRELSAQFGHAVSIYEDTVIVSAMRANGAAGAAYIFERHLGGNNNWGEVKKIAAPDQEGGDFFGSAVDIYKDVVVIGADKIDFAQIVNPDLAGEAYIFERNSGGTSNWGHVKTLKPSISEDFDNFGISVGIFEDAIVVGANQINDVAPSAFKPGAAYVFERNYGGSNNWGETKRLFAATGAVRDDFGMSVDIHQETIAVTARLEDDGAAYVYGKDQGGLNQWGNLKKLSTSDSASNEFGTAVSISENWIVVTDIFSDGNGNTPLNWAGSAFIFGKDNGGTNNWGEIGTIGASDANNALFFGNAVDVDAGTIVIGSDNNRSVYLYESPSTDPEPVTNRVFIPIVIR